MLITKLFIHHYGYRIIQYGYSAFEILRHDKKKAVKTYSVKHFKTSFNGNNYHFRKTDIQRVSK